MRSLTPQSRGLSLVLLSSRSSLPSQRTHQRLGSHSRRGGEREREEGKRLLQCKFHLRLRAPFLWAGGKWSLVSLMNSAPLGHGVVIADQMPGVPRQLVLTRPDGTGCLCLFGGSRESWARPGTLVSGVALPRQRWAGRDSSCPFLSLPQTPPRPIASPTQPCPPFLDLLGP